MYLLDTCVLSDFARGDERTLARVKATPPELLAVSGITAMEIEFGLALQPARARRLAPVMRAILASISILPYGIEDAAATATLRAALHKRGRPIGAYDVLLAGTAIARGLIFVTSNLREFTRITALAVEDWRA